MSFLSALRQHLADSAIRHYLRRLHGAVMDLIVVKHQDHLPPAAREKLDQAQWLISDAIDEIESAQEEAP